MNQFFDYNNNVFRVLGGLADCLILGALWSIKALYMDRAMHSGNIARL